jgi:hypothetical protein
MDREVRKGLIFGAEAAVAVAVGYVAELSELLSREQAFVFGLLAFIGIEVTRLRVESARQEQGLQGISAFIQVLVGDNAFSELRLLYGFRARGSRVSEKLVRVPMEDVRRFWRDCMARATTRWFVTTYALPDETWNLGWGTAVSQSIQRERIEAGCRITRVFVVDSEKERDKVLQTMKDQKSLGIEVRWILKEDLTSSSEVRLKLLALGTLDTAVVDESWVYRTELDTERHIAGASATNDQGLLESAQFVVKEAYAKATELSCDLAQSDDLKASE